MNLDINFLEIILVCVVIFILYRFGSFKNLFKAIVFLVISFTCLCLLNLIGAKFNLYIPINPQTIIYLSALGLPGLISLIVIYLLI